MRRLLLIMVAIIGGQPLMACDLCGIYSATETEFGKGPFAGLAEQFTHFGTLQLDGSEVPNPTDQYLNSSILQIFGGYNFTKRFGVQFNLPIIYRSFRRPEGFAIDEGHEAGVGDASLTGKLVVYRHQEEGIALAVTLMGGIKFPTGNSDRIKEELNETEVPGAPPSGVHGHDLTLGSGSYDGIIGGTVYLQLRRAFLSATAQYAIRTEGDFDYRFANDLVWSGGPGVLLLLKDDYTLSLQANVSGEHKDKDEFQGESVEDTGVTAVYIGPEFLLTWGEQLNVELGLDIPVSIENTSLQIVPDYRVRAAATWRF